MQSAFTAIDLSQLPAPAVIEALDYEAILSEMLADLLARDPAFTALTESDPAYKILEVAAYREFLMRKRVNDACHAVMLAYAKGGDLEQLAALWGVQRLLITPADDTTIPPTSAVYESDEELRARVLLANESFSSAGSRGAYIFHALSASGDCKGVAVKSLTPGVVTVTVLSRTGDGVAPQETIDEVLAALTPDDVRPLCDTVLVKSATITHYAILATLYFAPGVGQAEATAAAQDSVNYYTETRRKLGVMVSVAGIFAALMQPGIENVIVTSPAADIVCSWDESTVCDSITLTNGGVASDA